LNIITSVFKEKTQMIGPDVHFGGGGGAKAGAIVGMAVAGPAGAAVGVPLGYFLGATTVLVTKFAFFAAVNEVTRQISEE
jgi:hypothetical protein